MMLWGMHVILAGTFELFLDSCYGKIQPKQKWWLAFFLTFVTSRRSQLQWTLSKRPLLLSDQPFCFSVKYCFKNSLESDHYFNFLSDHDHFLGWKCDIFVCYLFPESDHPVWSRMIVKNHCSNDTKVQYMTVLTKQAAIYELSGMCRCEGYGFQSVYSGIGYINQGVWV